MRCLTAIFVLTLALSASAGDGFFLAIGGVNGTADDGHKLEGQFGTIYLSKDGETWQEVFRGGPVKEDFNHARNNLLRCLTYGKGKFVVTGNPHGVLVSENGTDWKVVEAPAGAMSVEFGNGMFLAPNAASNMVSTDGENWEMVRLDNDFKVWGKDGAGHVRKTIFGNGVFVCLGEQRLGVTKDGRSWLHHEIFLEEKRPGRQLMLFGNGQFVWLSEKLGPQHSDDGIHWHPIELPDLTSDPQFGQSGVFEGERFLISASKWNDPHKTIYASSDGITWSKATEDAGATSIATAGNGILLQNQGWSQSFTLSADKGKTWKQAKVNVPSRQVYFFDGKRIIGQSGG